MTSVESLINRQFLLWERQQVAGKAESEKRLLPQPIVTVSRQAGSRGSYFASRLALKLDFQRIHREVIEAICRSSGYRKRIVESLDERYRSELALLVESVVDGGKTIDHSDYVRHLCQVILTMARLGGVVLVGRGGSFILGPQRGLHLRIISPKSRRVRNLVTYKDLSADEAEQIVEESDARRKQFVRKVFGADIDDPGHYDLVMNFDSIDVEEMVDAAVVAYKGKMDKLAHPEHDLG